MRAVPFLVALGLVACKAPPTQLVVVVESDLAVPVELSSVRLKLFNAGKAVAPEAFPISGPDAIALPFSFGIAPPNPGAEDPVDITLSAIKADGSVGVETHRATRFRANHALLLPMKLLASCAAACTVGQACEQGGCVAALVDPTTLATVTPGQELDAVGKDAN